MKKEGIYVVIDSEEKRKRAVKILKNAEENIGDTDFYENYKFLRFDTSGEWNTFSFVSTSKTEINLDQLEQLLNPIQEVKKESMKKKNIYVVIDSESKRQRAVKILTDAGENIGCINFDEKYKYLRFDTSNEWNTFSFVWTSETEINLDELNEILNPKEEVKMELDALKLIAESYGFYLVEKPREIKVGDFGKFWDCPTTCPVYGYLQFISKGIYCYSPDSGSSYRNFAHLTDQEKEQLIKNL
jgi:rhodanese-related sulfurtransferase